MSPPFGWGGYAGGAGRTVLGARLGTWLSGWGGDYQMGSRERIFGVEVGLKEDWNGGEFLGG